VFANGPGAYGENGADFFIGFSLGDPGQHLPFPLCKSEAVQRIGRERWHLFIENQEVLFRIGNQPGDESLSAFP